MSIRRHYSNHVHLARGASALAITLVIQAGGGFLYWVFAARLTDTDIVGTATGLAASTAVIIYITNFGINFALARFAQDDGPADRQLLLLGALAMISTTAVGATLYVWIANSSNTDAIGNSSFGLIGFASLTSATSLAALVDVRLIALRKRFLVIARSALSAIARPLLLLLYSQFDPTGFGIFVILLLPDAITGLGGTIALAWGSLRSLIRNNWLEANLLATMKFSLVAYVAQFGIQTPLYVLPVIVLSAVERTEFAQFYIAWSIAAAVMFIPQAVMWALHIEGDREKEIGEQARVAFAISIAATGAATIFSVFAAPLITFVFGSDYSQAALILPWFVSGTIPWSLVVIAISESRVRQHSRSAITYGLVTGILMIVPALFLVPQFGLNGYIVSWTGGGTLGAIITLTARSLILHSGRT